MLRAGRGRLGRVFLQDMLSELLSDKGRDRCSRGGIVLRVSYVTSAFKLSTLILIQQDLFSSQNVSKSKDASLLPTKLPTSVSLFDDEDEEVNVATQNNQVFFIIRKLFLMKLYGQGFCQ